MLLAVTLGGGGWLWIKADREARQAQVTREVAVALNRATMLREQAKLDRVGVAGFQCVKAPRANSAFGGLLRDVTAGGALLWSLHFGLATAR